MAGDDLSLDAPLRGDDGDSAPRPASTGSRTAAAPPPTRRSATSSCGGSSARSSRPSAGPSTDEQETAIFEHRLLPPDGAEPLTLQEIGDRFGLTRERARQIEAKLTARLREYLEGRDPGLRAAEAARVAGRCRLPRDARGARHDRRRRRPPARSARLVRRGPLPRRDERPAPPAGAPRPCPGDRGRPSLRTTTSSDRGSARNWCTTGRHWRIRRASCGRPRRRTTPSG